MILFFNKQYWIELKIIQELKDKIKKSKTFEVSAEENNNTVYKLDSIDIIFHDWMSKEPGKEDDHNKIIVRDKSGKEMLCMDCGWWYGCDDMQQARFDWYHALYTYAHEREEKEEEKQKKIAKVNAASAVLEAEDKVKIQKKTNLQTMKETLEKLKGL